MSADQPEPHRTRTRTSARRARPARRHRTTKSEGVQLDDLRTRCRLGAFTGGGVYLAILATTVVRPTALTLKQIIGLEFGVGIAAMACAIIGVVVWLLTQNAEHALQIWGAATRSRSLEALPSPAKAVVPEPRVGREPIPISYAREVRAQRNRQAI